ncbi:MAG TPA: hypothetical protein DCS63_01680 [Elusimicrobia bacterium]|nr:hypothetical protein [Elusimicrobiota bacterium]
MVSTTPAFKRTPGAAWLRQKWTARFCALTLLFACACSAAAAGANLEEKMKYERALEQKVEEVLANLLGPGKSRVMIRAALDFSSKENVALETEKPEARMFGWQNMNQVAASNELLPGVPDAKQEAQPAQPVSGNYRREVIFPQTMVKRLTVSLVLSEGISEAEAQKVRRVVSDLLALDPARGDDILVMRARFAPIWYTSEMLGTLVKYGLISVIAIVGMGIVSMGFLKMASAMRSMAGPEASNIRMEMGGAMGGEADALGLPEHDEPGATAEKTLIAGQPEGDSSGAVIFNIKADKLEILVRMLANDEPADISIIAVHLPSDLRGKFMSLLPPQKASEVFANIAKVRFVEPELIVKIKEELERRLNGAVGGYEKAVEMIEKVSLTSKKAMLEALKNTHPDIAAQIRQRVLLLDDLEHFADTDLAILVGTLSVEQWAAAAWRISEGLRAKIKTHLSERAWQIMEQTMAYNRPTDAKIDAAAEEVIAAAWKLIAEGRIKKPGADATAIGVEPAALRGA